MTHKYIAREIMLYCVVILFLLVGYNSHANIDQTWFFLLSTMLIFLTLKCSEGVHWRTRLGLKKFPALCVLSSFLLLPAILGSQWLIQRVLPDSFQFAPHQLFSLETLRVFCQCFNEEIVFHGLLLTSPLFSTKPKMKAVMVSLFFALGHLIFYRFNRMPENRGLLEATALLTLFMFSLACSFFFLATQSILLPLMAHFSWNLNRFSTSMFSKETGERTVEFETFNLIEGSWPVCCMSFLLLSLSFLLLKSRSQMKESESF